MRGTSKLLSRLKIIICEKIDIYRENNKATETIHKTTDESESSLYSTILSASLYVGNYMKITSYQRSALLLHSYWKLLVGDF